MDNRYTLPALPYDYAALEPRYSAKLLELHHDKRDRDAAVRILLASNRGHKKKSFVLNSVQR
jgi:superoxide dismutase